MGLSWLRHDRLTDVGNAHPPRAGTSGKHEREAAASPASPSSSRSSSSPAPRLSSVEVTALRVRALQGDPLCEVRDATREWVFRSLLIGKHLDEWATLAGVTEPRQLEQSLARVRRWYQQRLKRYHAIYR